MKNLSAIRRVLYVSIALNLVAIWSNWLSAIRWGALSLVADDFDPLYDAAGNLILLKREPI